MAEESKIKSIAAMSLVLLAMAGFVYLLIMLPLGRRGSSGSGWRVDCHRIRVRVIAEGSREPIENAEAAWWPCPSANRDLGASPLREDHQGAAEFLAKPSVVAATDSNGECVLVVTVWGQGWSDTRSGRNKDKDADAPKLKGVLKVRADGFEPLSRDMVQRLPIDVNAVVEVTLKRVETIVDVIPSEIRP